VAPERIIKKDYQYMARILLARNQGYSKLVDSYNSLQPQLEREKARLSGATTAADRTKYKASVDELTQRMAQLDSEIKKADVEIDRAFREYDKLLAFNPEDRALLNEIAANYYSFRRYVGAAQTWGKMISLGRDDVDDYMRIGRAYYNAERYKSADSIFNIVLQKSPDYLDAYVYIARTYSRMDPDSKKGIARPKFEMLLNKAATDSVKNASQMMEAFNYLGYYHTMTNNPLRAKDYYNRMVNLDPDSRDNKIRGYIGLASIETELARVEPTLEGKVAILNRAIDAYNRVIALDPSNASVRNMLKSIQDYQASIKKGINPNEIRGIIRDSAGQPIAYASIRVKDTAAENLTNSKGEYKFEIPAGSEALIVSADGYATKEIPVTSSRIYNVVLERQ
jgi:tetratricopeptide (TPR) repeat protein